MVRKKGLTALIFALVCCHFVTFRLLFLGPKKRKESLRKKKESLRTRAVARQHGLIEALCQRLDENATFADVRRWEKRQGGVIHERKLCSGRWFATSDRKDYAFVAEELEELGLCNAGTNESRRLAAYVGEQFESLTNSTFQHGAFEDDAIVSAMPGLMRSFGTKSSFAEIFAECDDDIMMGDRGLLCDDASLLITFNVIAKKGNFLPPKVTSVEAWVFPALRVLLVKKEVMWLIVKPSRGSFGAEGIHMTQLPRGALASKRKFHAWLGRNVVPPHCFKVYTSVCSRREMSFQRYVDNPALMDGRKFDVRTWFLITKLNPLTIYGLRHGYPKIASMPFSRDPKHLQEQCIHIKMLDDRCPLEYLERFARRNGYPRSTASRVFFDDLTSAEIKLQFRSDLISLFG